MKNKGVIIGIIVAVVLFLCCCVGIVGFLSLRTLNKLENADDYLDAEIEELNSDLDEYIDSYNDSDSSGPTLEENIEYGRNYCYETCESVGVEVETCKGYCDDAYDNYGIDTNETQDKSNCDDSNSEYKSFHGVEDVIVSENPCDVMWILAQKEESYTMETKKGTTIYVDVWRDYINNVKPGDTFTIRALDVVDDGISKDREDAGISITRWVANESDLEKAKEEVNDVIKKLDY